MQASLLTNMKRLTLQPLGLQQRTSSDLRRISEVTDKLKDKFGADAAVWYSALEYRVQTIMPGSKTNKF